MNYCTFRSIGAGDINVAFNISERERGQGRERAKERGRKRERKRARSRI